MLKKNQSVNSHLKINTNSLSKFRSNLGFNNLNTISSSDDRNDLFHIKSSIKIQKIKEKEVELEERKKELQKILLKSLLTPESDNLEKYVYPYERFKTIKKNEEDGNNQNNKFNMKISGQNSYTNLISSDSKYNEMIANSLNNYLMTVPVNETEKKERENLIKFKKLENKETSKLNIKIEEFAYKNPSSSLNVLYNNNKIFNDISKSNLLRQKHLINNSIKKYSDNLVCKNIRMPKIRISELAAKIGQEFENVIIDKDEEEEEEKQEKKTKNNKNEEDEFEGINVDEKNCIRLFSYYKYPLRNFPEGKQQFQILILQNKIVITGGLSSSMDEMILWQLNVEKLQWKKMKTKNHANSRYGHTSLLYMNNIYFFGGKIKINPKAYSATPNDLEILNLNDFSFSSPELNHSPKSRKNHIALIVGNQMFIHGGIDENNQILDDVHLFNFENPSWVNANINKYLNKILNNVPTPKLYGHTACLVIPLEVANNHKFNIYRYPDIDKNLATKMNKIKQKGIYVFGGKKFFNDFSLNTNINNNSYAKEIEIGDKNSELSNDIFVLLIGSKTLNWIKLETNGKQPCPRYFHSMNYYEKANILIVHGGRNDSISASSGLNDTFIFNLENLTWVTVELYSNTNNFKVFYRYGHQTMIFSNKLLIFGGFNNVNYIGSIINVINLDFNFTSQQKTFEQMQIDKLKKSKSPEAKRLLIKFKKNLHNIPLAVAQPITLPPIK